MRNDHAPSRTERFRPEHAADHARSHGAAPTSRWGPVEAGGGRRRRWPRRLALLVVLVIALPLAWGWALASHGLDSMQRQAVPALTSTSGGRMNVLLTGSDSRADLTAEERNELATGSAEGERTDVIMVLSVAGGAADLLAFPRDLWVTRCDGTVGRINAALSHGGTTCLVSTIQDLSGIPIHHAMAIDFGGFRDLVDAVGGVEMCTDKPLVDRKAGLDLEQGCHLMDGGTALGFVRTRQLDSDLQRIQRQQQFLGKLVATTLTPQNLLDPRRAWGITGSAGSVITADERLGMWDMVRLARGARSLGGGLDPQIVPATPEWRSGKAVLIPDLAAAEALFAPLRVNAGRPGGGDGDAAAGGAVTPADVRVAVLNGTDVAGLAGRVSEQLDEQGWDVIHVGNGPPTSSTQVVHGGGLAAAGSAVDADLTGTATLTEATELGDLQLPEDADVVVLVGPDLAE